MTTVYIVTEGEYSAYGICRVFSTKEQADEWLEKIGVEDRQDYTIEEYDLDDMSLRPCTFIKVILNINTREVYEIRKNIKNENDECETRHYFQRTSKEKEEYNYKYEDGLYKPIKTIKESVFIALFSTEVKTTDEKTAVKVANERLNIYKVKNNL
jgi:hypothetical protein